jgi:hypothetical protein
MEPICLSGQLVSFSQLKLLSRFVHEEVQMLAHNADGPQLVSRVPLTTIDASVSDRLGTTRVNGNTQPAVFNRQVAMYLAKHVGGWSTTRIGSSITAEIIPPSVTH